MATKVWKCDHCYSSFFDTENDALKHETSCSFNPSIKQCNTCKSYEETGYPISGSDMRCMNSHSPLYDKTITYFMDDHKVEDFFPCPYWVKE